jgi:hypothetical protein
VEGCGGGFRSGRGFVSSSPLHESGDPDQDNSREEYQPPGGKQKAQALLRSGRAEDQATKYNEDVQTRSENKYGELWEIEQVIDCLQDGKKGVKDEPNPCQSGKGASSILRLRRVRDIRSGRRVGCGFGRHVIGDGRHKSARTLFIDLGWLSMGRSQINRCGPESGEGLSTK